jgi:hypothetical protein
MSLTSRVPAAVPSLTQSSPPLMLSFAMKKILSPTATKSRAPELAGPFAMSFNIRVPEGVPSLTHGSIPETESLMLK